jgi:hypothetical protein
MDRFADGMTARGPTLGADGDAWTGSLHIVDLPDDDAARAFVEHEPYNRAGLFEDHLIRRFDNLAGRDMWQFRREPQDPRFLVIARHRPEAGGDLPAASWARPGGLPSERLIFHGELHPLEASGPSGVAFAIQAPTRASVDALLTGGPAGADPADIEVHLWEFGGRR